MIVQGPEVAAWVYEKTGGVVGPCTIGLGWMKDGVLTAGFAFEAYNGHNMIAHQRQDQMAPRAFWKAAADYCFRTLKLSRVTGLVNATNDKAIRLNKHIGYEVESVMTKAADDGGDVVVMVLWPEKCRIFDWK